MKILTCIKQVPGSNNVEVDPVTGVLKRSGVSSKIKSYVTGASPATAVGTGRVGIDL